MCFCRAARRAAGVVVAAQHAALQMALSIVTILFSFTLASDPDAAGFYEHMGAVRVGEVWNEFQKVNLPVMRVDT
ncbi:hypothetical protein [Pelagicoccus mobilis]|nr:hypothetical protein [Pelagicoccus mobilis]